MGSGLSLVEQLDELKDVEARIGKHWEGRLEEWLQTILPYGCVERYGQSPKDDDDSDPLRENESLFDWSERQRNGVQCWSFPTDELHDEYVRSVRGRAESDVLALLRLFLFEGVCFGGDRDNLDILIHRPQHELQPFPVEYKRRLFGWVGGGLKPHPGVRWVLDLLPNSPQSAIDVIQSYLQAYFGLLPDGRIEGLFDATSVIRSYWIDNVNAGDVAGIDSRVLEKLAAALYRSWGYKVTLTPPGRDGGRDVIGDRSLPGRQETVEIECKSHLKPVGVDYVRKLQGVVSRGGSSRGVLVSSGVFTRGARIESASDPRIELIDGGELVKLLNAEFGPAWQAKIERIVWGVG